MNPMDFYNYNKFLSKYFQHKINSVKYLEPSPTRSSQKKTLVFHLLSEKLPTLVIASILSIMPLHL